MTLLIDNVESGITGDEARRRELAAFLRSRRERLQPEQFGLPLTRRRRTPGLRREEVAELAGVGVTWYTWLEQARDIHVSSDVIEAVARTLLLDPDERQHLFDLSGLADTTHEHGVFPVTAATQAILNALAPYPALVTTARYDVLAWNSQAAALLGEFASMPEADRNLIWLAFTSQAWQTLLADYDDHVARMVRRLRAGMGRHVGEPWWEQFIERMCATSAHFRELWELREVATRAQCEKLLWHPLVGPLRFNVTMFRMDDLAECDLRVWTPSDPATLASLRRLPASTPSRPDGIDPTAAARPLF